MIPVTGSRLLDAVLPVLGLDERFATSHLRLLPGNGLPSHLGSNDLACGSVAAFGLATAALTGQGHVTVDPRRVSASFRVDQLMSLDGAPVQSFAPLSGFFAAQDGWVRTHANYRHHASALLRALHLPESAERREVAEAINARRTDEVEDAVFAAGGVAVRVRSREEWAASEQGRACAEVPVLSCDHVGGDDEPAPAPTRPKVLDLTRVIAGPVATRALGRLGWDVLRVDPPAMPEIPEQFVMVGEEKRSVTLDFADHRDRQTLEDLLAEADVLVSGYRPGALAAYGLDAATVAHRYPRVVIADLSAWTAQGPWAGRRGFDSIVQAATGISLAESVDGQRPGSLPAQVLDHATGRLIAAGILAALRRRSFSGGSWHVAAHLASTAAWLLSAHPDDEPGVLLEDPSDHLAMHQTPMGRVMLPRPSFDLGTVDSYQFRTEGYGRDEARWTY